MVQCQPDHQHEQTPETSLAKMECAMTPLSLPSTPQRYSPPASGTSTPARHDSLTLDSAARTIAVCNHTIAVLKVVRIVFVGLL